MQLTNGRIKLEKKISFLYLYIHATLEEKKKCHHWINIRFSSVFCSDKKKKNTYMIKKKKTNKQWNRHSLNNYLLITHFQCSLFTVDFFFRIFRLYALNLYIILFFWNYTIVLSKYFCLLKVFIRDSRLRKYFKYNSSLIVTFYFTPFISLLLYEVW